MKRLTYFALCGIFCFSSMVTMTSAQPVSVCKSHDGNAALCKKKDELLEKRMDAFIAQKMEEDNAIGVSVVVVQNNRTVYQKGFGYADVENEVPVDSTTVFHIGSITKLFTGIGIMQLVQQGLLDIDAPIQQYLPEFSIKYHEDTDKPITIRSIMTHQSGIFGDKSGGLINATYPEADFRIYPEFAGNEYAAYHPNYITAYSNFAVSLLGLIIERVSGIQYESYIRDHILQPCGMNESGFDPTVENASQFSKGYDAAGNVFPYYYTAFNPAGFMASSSSDMAGFIKMILNRGKYKKNRILNPKVLRKMYWPHSIYVPMNLPSFFGSPYNFGLSWMLENCSFGYLGRVIGHGGNLPPYNSKLLIADRKKIGVFITANKGDFYPDEIAEYALVAAAEIYNGAAKPELPAVPPVTVMPDYLKGFSTGTYCVLGTIPIEIYEKNDTMFLHALHSARIPLVYHTDNWSSLYINNSLVPDVRFSVRLIDNKKVLCVESRSMFKINRFIYGNNFLPEPIPDELMAMTGIYSELSSGQPALVIQTDILSQSNKPFLMAVSLEDNSVLAMQPAENSTLIIQGIGRSAQETIRIVNDTINYSGYSFVKTADHPLSRERSVAKIDKQTSIREQQEQFIDKLKKSIRKQLTM